MQIGDADAYHFSLRFRLPAHQCIDGRDIPLILGNSAVGDRLKLHPTDNTSLEDARHLGLYGYGYNEKITAEDAYRRARKAIALAARESSCGVAIAKDNFDVWKGNLAVGRFGAACAASLIVGVGADDFRARLVKWLADCPDLTVDQSLCIDMLLDYHFDLNVRSRSLLAYAAIERLCSQPMKKEESYVEALNRLTDAIPNRSNDPAVRAQ